jgi:hypothetical protein
MHVEMKTSEGKEGKKSILRIFLDFILGFHFHFLHLNVSLVLSRAINCELRGLEISFKK